MFLDSCLFTCTSSDRVCSAILRSCVVFALSITQHPLQNHHMTPPLLAPPQMGRTVISRRGLNNLRTCTRPWVSLRQKSNNKDESKEFWCIYCIYLAVFLGCEEKVNGLTVNTEITLVVNIVIYLDELHPFYREVSWSALLKCWIWWSALIYQVYNFVGFTKNR